MLSKTHNISHLLLSIAFAALSVTLFEPVMGWIHILVLCAILMRLTLFLGIQKHIPSLRTLNLLAVLSGLVLAYFSWQLGALLAMINLLVMACALKLMLLRTQRDYYQLILSLLFLVGCGFIFHQGIGFSLVLLGTVCLLLLSLISHQSPNQPVLPRMKTCFIIMLQALPIAVLLFIVMPKLTPFWQMPTAKGTATGLSDSITPGDIASLSQSSDLAFRATFYGQIPPPEQRYWRAIVLEDFDGKTWSVANQRKLTRNRFWRAKEEFSPKVSGPYYSYEVIAEASQKRWLYALDLAVPEGAASQQAIWQSREFQLLAVKPLLSNFQYNVRSYPQVALNQGWTELDIQLNQQVPDEGNPLTRQWVASLLIQYQDKRQLANAILDHFIQQDFRYTLQPEQMLTDPVDTFLFEKQAGFCSHYASSTAFALRLAGIPARVIAGYQGGEVRENAYLSVHQYDAHAWVEAWFDESGWQRLDPTAVVAPDRIRLGLEQAVQEEGSFLQQAPFSLARMKSIAWINQLRFTLADLDYLWSRWVLGFDQQSQEDLFKSLLGALTPQKLAFIGLAVIAFIAILLALFFLPGWAFKKHNPALKRYQQALQLIAPLNIQRLAWQGPADFANAISSQCEPTISQPFQRLSDLLIRYQFRPGDKHATDHKTLLSEMDSELQKLKRAINRLN